MYLNGDVDVDAYKETLHVLIGEEQSTQTLVFSGGIQRAAFWDV